MYILGYSSKHSQLQSNWLVILTFVVEVVYRAGVNEKLLGDFIRKHNVRDKVFCKSYGSSRAFERSLTASQWHQSVVSIALEAMEK